MLDAFWQAMGSIGLNESAVQFMLVNAILGLSVYLTLNAGMFSLAQAGFMAVGAYAGALATVQLGWPLWASLLVGMGAAAVLAIPVGLPTLRLRDIYLAIATIGFGEIVRELLVNFDELVKAYQRTFMGVARPRFELLRGARGLNNIPTDTETWHLLLFLVIIGYALVRLHHSRLGRAMVAIRQDERAAANMGINVVYIKNLVFVLSALLAGAAGVFNAHLTRIILPTDYGFDRAVDILAFAVLGGTGTWIGPVIGGLVLGALPEVFRAFAQYRGIATGLVLLLAILYLPQGLVGVPNMLARALRRGEAAP